MEAPKFRKVACNITNGHLKKMGEVVGPQRVLGSLDRSGVPHKGYAELFNIMKDGLRSVDKKLRLKAMPNPFQVRLSTPKSHRQDTFQLQCFGLLLALVVPDLFVN